MANRRQLILITGGSQGLGEAMGIELAKRGADIVLVSRSEEKLKLALQKVEVLRAFGFWTMLISGCSRVS